jgi:hypothetical protein
MKVKGKKKGHETFYLDKEKGKVGSQMGEN